MHVRLYNNTEGRPWFDTNTCKNAVGVNTMVSQWQWIVHEYWKVTFYSNSDDDQPRMFWTAGHEECEMYNSHK